MKNSYYIKNAFTLIEILIVFVVIGVISVITITTCKPFNKAKPYLYSRAYDTLSTAWFNAIEDNSDILVITNGKETSEERSAKYDDNLSVENPENPSETEDSENNSYELDSDKWANSYRHKICVGLTKYINSKRSEDPYYEDATTINDEDNYCSATWLSKKALTPNILAQRINKNKETSTDDDKIKPDFIASNGMAFYISRTVVINSAGFFSLLKDYDGITKSIDDPLNYVVIFVDINGIEKGPSIVDTTSATSNDIDVYPFALLQTGDIIPLGPKAVTSNLISARIEYPDGTESEPMTYLQATYRAWGLKFLYSMPQTIPLYNLKLLITDIVAFTITNKSYDETTNLGLDPKCGETITEEDEDGETKIKELKPNMNCDVKVIHYN